MSMEKQLQSALKPHLAEGEILRHAAYGVKQPHMLLIILLVFCAILPGIIAIFFLTKNYIVGLTNKRLIILTVKATALDEVKAIKSIDLSQLTPDRVKTKTGPIFTHIEIQDQPKDFKAKFHRAFSPTNRPEATAIAQALAHNGSTP